MCVVSNTFDLILELSDLLSDIPTDLSAPSKHPTESPSKGPIDLSVLSKHPTHAFMLSTNPLELSTTPTDSVAPSNG